MADRMQLSVRDIALLTEALTTAASRHDSQARAGHKPTRHRARASAMRELACRLVVHSTPIKVARRKA